MANPTQVQLSFIYGTVRKILDYGREHGMENAAGTLKLGTICKNIVTWALRLRHDPVTEIILQNEGGNLETLVDRWKVEYATRKGYIRKGKLS